VIARTLGLTKQRFCKLNADLKALRKFVTNNQIQLEEIAHFKYNNQASDPDFSSSTLKLLQLDSLNNQRGKAIPLKEAANAAINKWSKNAARFFLTTL
jgi:hypothetical protein